MTGLAMIFCATTDGGGMGDVGVGRREGEAGGPEVSPEELAADVSNELETA